MRGKVVGAVLVWTLVGVTACASSEDANDVAVPENLAEQVAEVVCMTVEGCLADTYPLFYGRADCVQTWSARLDDELGGVRDAIAAGKVVYDGAAMEACLNAAAGADCSSFTERGAINCAAALSGQVPLDAACSLDTECEGEAYCLFEGGECPGRCRPLEEEGGPCRGDGNCASSLTCTTEAIATSGPSGTCQPLPIAFSNPSRCAPSQGQLCEVSAVCEFLPSQGSYLPGPNGTYGNESRCRPRIQRGGACGGTVLCAAGLSCVAGTCRAPRELGASCEGDADCASGFCRLGECALSNVCPGKAARGRTCAQLGREGDECGPDRPICGAGLVCIGEPPREEEDIPEPEPGEPVVVSDFDCVPHRNLGVGQLCSLSFPDPCASHLYCAVEVAAAPAPTDPPPSTPNAGSSSGSSDPPICDPAYGCIDYASF